MRIQYNQGLFTQNRYNHTNTELNKTLHKLSSGYRINQAADDAAGLSISEKMRAQIRGLEQAGENISDGISLVNVADAGLANIQDPNLIRIRELAIQAANDTNTDEDRQKIQMEINQLVKGIDNIANNTEFNTTKLLNVPDVRTVEKVNYINTEQTEIQVTVHPQQQVVAGYIEIPEGNTDPIEIIASFGSITGASWPDMNIVSPKDEEFGYADQYLNSSGPITNTTNNSSSEATYNGYNSSNEKFSFKNPVAGRWYIRIHHDGGQTTSTFTVKSNHHIIGLLEVSEETNTSTETIVKEPALKIQVGANEGQHMIIDLTDARSNVLGIDKIDVSTQIGAQSAINIVDNAMAYVSAERSKYGAYMNVLEHALNNVNNATENLTKAESILRDADMASEVSKLEKDRILLQSSQSMMAQINQMSQGILEILG